MNDVAGIDIEFDQASDHDYNCQCMKCLKWWAKMGPDGGEPGQYGPFTTSQVNMMQVQLGIPTTP